MSDYGSDLAFTWFQPTRTVFGAGTVGDLALECKRLGVERAVVVTDKILREKTQVVARVQQVLGARCAGIFDGVVPDTSVHTIDQGAAFAKGKGADGVISVGGGSSIDTAKGMAIVLTMGGSIRDHQGSQSLGKKQTTHIAVPTTAGTGSEVSQFAVVKDTDAHEKMHYADDHIVPDSAILDPELTVGMPRGLTAATGADALTHAIEAYQSVNRNPMADALALAAIRLIAEHLPRACEDGSDLVARGQMLVAANLAGLAFNASGVGLVHAMAHIVGARYGVHHGTANAICLPHVMRFNADQLAPRLRDIGQALGVDVRGQTDEAAAQAAADAVVKLNARIGLPAHLREVGVPEQELPACAQQSMTDGAIVYNGKFVEGEDLVLGVYRAAY